MNATYRLSSDRRETIATEVLALFRRGLDTMQIAAELWITEAQCVEFLHAARARSREPEG